MTDPLTTLAQQLGDKLALIDDRPDGGIVRWSFVDLEAGANRLARVFLDHGARPKYSRESMRAMIANATPWSYALKLACLEHFPEDSLFEVYGSTEFGVNTIMTPEIEHALEHHEDIVEAAVFGIPSEEWSESVHAVVVKQPESALDEAAVQTFAREHPAGYKVPRSVSFADEIPKTGSGKILKRELRASFWKDRASDVL